MAPSVSCRTSASRVFNYAVRSPGSWAHNVKLQLQSCGGLLPDACGVLPRAQAAQLQWRRSVVRPFLQRDALTLYRAELTAVPSLRPFLEYQPHLVCASQVHGGRLAPHVVREWTLARCGHHPFPDGRNARHRASADPHGAQQSCLCGNPSWSLLHGLRHCSLFDMQRQTWRLHMRRCAVDIALRSCQTRISYV